MKRTDKIAKIQGIEKEEEIHEILMDLLPAMGYTDVILTHERGSRPENGKDIVVSILDKIENKKEWTAFVVKKGDIKGTSAGVQEVKAQAIDCFNYSWHSISKGKNNKINKVKIVTNGKFNSGAIDKILEDQTLSGPNINFWSATELVDFIDKYCPRIWLKGDRIYKQYIEIFQKNNKTDDLAKAIGLKDEKLLKIVDYAIQPKLIELSIADNGELRKRLFDLNSVANFSDSALVCGEAGSGKSTFFKQLAQDIILQNSLRNDFELYPFIIKFTDFIGSDFDMVTVLKNHITSDGLKDIEIDINSLLEKQNFVLFIDALDELGKPELKDKALTAVQEFQAVYNTVKVYCSSRHSDSLLKNCQELNFRYLEISNVTFQQAEQFMSRYFDDDMIKCKRLLKSLKDSKILDKLPKTPLTLALIAALFDENEYEIPATISDLYKYFVEIMLSKSITNSTLDLLKIGVHKSVLSFIAEQLHVSRKKMVHRDELVALIVEFAKERGHKYDPQQLLDELIDSVGLLVQNEKNEIQFQHLSFQEYFTAYQFYNHNIDGKSHFVNNFNDIWWQNVAIFYAGMTKDSPNLIQEILEKSVPKTFVEHLINLSGIGYLLQALYNTPISSRIEGVKRNVHNAERAVDILLENNEPELDYFKKVFNTRFGVFRIISYWFEFHHSSITLKEPLEQRFKEIIIEIGQLELIDTQRVNLEYAAYLLAATLTDIDNQDYSRLKELYSIVNESNNYFVLGLIDSHFNDKYKLLDKEQKRRKEVRKFKEKLNSLKKDAIIEYVNISLTDGLLVEKKGNRKADTPEFIKFTRPKAKG